MERTRRAKRIFVLRCLVLVGFTLALAPAGCRKKPAGQGETLGVPQPLPPIGLSPLPEPPAVTVAPEALPGTGNTLAVVVARPTGQALGNFRPTITFSKPVVALGTVEHEKGTAEPAQFNPPLPGEWRWLGSASVEFVPKGLVPYATQFTVTIPSGLAALDGSKLEKPYTWTFETPHPTAQSIEPREGWQWLTPKSSFSIVFNQPVSDLGNHLRLEVGEDHKVWPFKIEKEISVVEELRAREPNRHYPRMGSAERGFENRQTRYQIEVSQPLPLDSPVALVVSPDLRGKDGPLTLGNERRYEFRSYGPMKVQQVRACWESQRCPYGPLLILTSNKAEVKTLQARLRIEPAVQIDWDRVEGLSGEMDVGRPYLTVPGKFRPGTSYDVRIAAGLEDEFGQKAAEFEGRIHTSDLEPSFDAGAEEALLEADGDGALPVEVTNLRTLKTKFWELSPAEMARLLAVPGTREHLVPDDPPVVQKLEPPGPMNVVQTLPFAVRPLLRSKRTGLFFASLEAPELDEHAWRRIQGVAGQITNLAVHAKLGATSGLVWVTQLSDGRSVDGAELVLYDSSGRALWRGRSDADGLCSTPGLAETLGGESHPTVLVAASKNGDTGVTLSHWAGGFSPSAFGLSSDWDGQYPRSLGTVVSERGIYRPGDQVFVKGLARYRRMGRILTPEKGSKIALKVVSSRGQEVLSKQLTITGFGTFSTDFALGKDVALGTYQMTATSSLDGESLSYGGSFRVEEYRAPQFKVDVTTASKHLAAGDALDSTVLARYLFGGAMPNADVKWTVTRSTLAFEPPGNEGFVFGSQSWWWDDETPAPSSDTFAAGEGLTDGLGALAIAAGKVEALGDRTWRYTVEAEVADVSRQRMANRVAVTVHPASLYAGVRPRTSGFAEVGKSLPMELIAVDPGGTRQSGARIQLVLKRREWRWIRKKGVGHRWFTVSEPTETVAETCKVKSDRTPAECAFTPKEPGLYIAEATVEDGQGRKQTTRSPLYVIGNGWISWQRNDTDRIDLVADKPVYDVGETARVLVKSPYPEADAIVTVEREGVLSAKRMKLTGAATALSIPIDAKMIPNVFVGVVLVRGRVQGKEGAETGDDPGRPAVRVGYALLKVERKEKRLAVQLTPDKSEKRPRDKVKVELRVTDWKGQGARAEVAVWAVDEGVLRLTDYQVPDPIDALHPPRGLSVMLGEPLIHLVQRKLYGEKGKSSGGSGGGDASGSGFRSQFKTTVLFAPEVVTDAEGRAHVEFELPDNLTTYRLMAMAITEGDQAGKGQSEVVVSKPLLALPALPRLARVGDRFEAGVVVHSPGAKVKEVEVRAEAKGLTLEGKSERRVSIADGKPVEVRFGFKAEAAGEAVLRFTLSGGGERDGVEQRIPVQLPVAPEAVAIYGDTDGVRKEGFKPPGGVRPDMGGLELSLASTALGGFSESMRQLIDYPFGCLEQLTSRLVPFVALRELQGKFSVGAQAPDAAQKAQLARREWFLSWLGEEPLRLHETRDPDEVVRRAVKAIEMLQNPDGGYRYWTDSDCSSEWASSYTVLALGRAAEVGYPVDAAGLARAQKYLAETVAAGSCTPCRGGGCSKPNDATRVFALYALARTRAPRASYYPELFGRRDKLPLFSQAMLTDALFIGGGDRGQARQLLAELLNHAKESPAEVHFEETDALTYATLWSSDPRTTAIVLQTLTDVSPDHPYVSKIAHYLTKVRRADGTFRNTQESAFALMALTEVVRTKEKDPPDFEAQVTLGPSVVTTVPFRGRSMAIQRVSIPMAKLPGAGDELPFEFKRDGKAGVLYYGALLRYAPQVVPIDPLDRGMVVQRWFEPYAGGGQVKAVRSGELVRVRVRVATHMERNFVAVDVPLPSGLEVVDTTLATTAQGGRTKGVEGRRRGYGYESAEDLGGDGDGEGGGEEQEGGGEGDVSDRWAYSFWSPFNHTENRDDRVVLFADRLPPGVHVASFVARATTPGDFILRAARAEEMYTPEVFGRSDGGTFKVVDSNELAER